MSETTENTETTAEIIVKKPRKPRKRPHKIFTHVYKLKEEEITSPPVVGCECTYCQRMRVNGYAVWPSMTTWGWRGGDERHNPENKARIVLKEKFPLEVVEEYARKGRFWFQGPSGVWYLVGRTVINTNGHGIVAFEKKFPSEEFDKGLARWHRYDSGHPLRERIAYLCVQPHGVYIPLADAVYAYYLLVQAHEKDLWLNGAAGVQIAKAEVAAKYGLYVPPIPEGVAVPGDPAPFREPQQAPAPAVDLRPATLPYLTVQWPGTITTTTTTTTTITGTGVSGTYEWPAGGAAGPTLTTRHAPRAALLRCSGCQVCYPPGSTYCFRCHRHL